MNTQTIQERLEVPVAGGYDIIVSGGGPAGIAAALAAAGQGLKTLLVEVCGCLGGVWTSGMLTLILDMEGKGGLMQRIKQELALRGEVLPRNNNHNFIYDVESMKILLEDLCREAGVHVLLHSRVVQAVQESGKLKAICVEGMSGRLALEAKVFVDCTGNGDLAARAGCSFDMGHPETGQIQPASMHAIVRGVPESFRTMETYESKRAFRDYLNGLTCETSNKAPTIIALPLKGTYVLSVNHQFDVRCDDSFAVTEATLQGRAEIHSVIRLLRRQPEWSELELIATPPHIAMREGRRLRGLYKLTLDDIVTGQKFADGVCMVKFAVDIHATNSSQTHGYGNAGITTQPYHVPFRSLVSSEIQNLAFAGRCISGDFYAHASYRITSTAVAMGEAVGIAAAEAIACGGSFHEVQGEQVAAEMKRRGYEL
ncbi:FAD-dependent oxidoreductase [Paenibacillus sp. strain BS8-2]